MVNFGIIGTNFVSDWMVAGGQQDCRFKALAVYSRGEETGKAFAERHAIERVYTSLDEMLDDGEIDAVYIASPTSLHASQTIRCLEAGKHVLCEKPMASNAREVQEKQIIADGSYYTYCVTMFQSYQREYSPGRPGKTLLCLLLSIFVTI